MEKAQIKSRILVGLAYAQTEIHEISKQFGYWDKERNLGEIFSLIHRDAAKALEIITIADGPSERLKDVSRAEEKLADVIIRIFDLSQGKGLRVAAAVLAKMEYNEQLSKAIKKDY